MVTNIFIAAVALVAVQAQAVSITKVIDGETLVAGSLTLKLAGVDAPGKSSNEFVPTPYYEEAIRFVERLALGKTVSVESAPEGAYVFLPDGKLLNTEIIRAGFAANVLNQKAARYQLFRQMNQEALDNERGLWGGKGGTPEEAWGQERKAAEAKAQAEYDSTVVNEASYFSPVAMNVRAEPSATAPIVARVEPMDVLSIHGITTGWIRVLKDKQYGWVKSTEQNIVRGNIFDVMLRKVKTEGETWPAKVKHAIIRGEIEIGFTADQVKATLGEPLSAVSEKTAAGTTDVWVYPLQAVTFKAGRVAAIRTTQK